MLLGEARAFCDALRPLLCPSNTAGTSELTVGNVHIKAFDLGGHEAARKLWTTYFEQVDAVVYLIDCADVERFPEAKKELDVRPTTLPPCCCR